MLRFTKHNLLPLVIYISWFLQRKSQAYSLTLFVIRAATLLVHTCQDATFGLITIAINLLIHPSHSKFSVMFFYCLPNNSCDGSLEDLVLDQLANPWLIFFFYSHHLSAWYSTLLSQSWEFWNSKSFENYCNLQIGRCYMASLQDWISQKPKISWFS